MFIITMPTSSIFMILVASFIVYLYNRINMLNSRLSKLEKELGDSIKKTRK